ncbi:alpha/beta-hydrolase, partial [Fragilariopsis cylindrus CCMP1102]
MIVYLHGNASARVEVVPNLSFLLGQVGVFGVVGVDFTGSGKSDGDYVSLGYYERTDLDCVVQHLQRVYGNGNNEIVIWGRSMGASAALMYAEETSCLKGMICDSPFASLTLLCEELVERARQQGVVVPGVIVSVAIAMIARSVRLLANFNIREITPLEDVATIDIPALFIVGADDDFIPPHHSERLIESYKSGVTTNLFMVPGGHNDARPKVVFEGIEEF